MTAMIPVDMDLDAVFSIEELQTLESIKNGEIPTSFPSTITPIDCIDSIKEVGIEQHFKNQFRAFSFKDTCQGHGQYGYISKTGAKWLTDRFPKHTWLDPLAGRGWFKKALEEQGAKVYAADIAVWDNPVSDVVSMDGKKFVHKYRDLSDILILSWVEKDNIVDYECAMAWGSHKPILLYGEPGMCCNSSEFVDRFIVDEVIGDFFPDLSCKPTKRTSMYLGHLKA